MSVLERGVDIRKQRVDDSSMSRLKELLERDGDIGRQGIHDSVSFWSTAQWSTGTGSADDFSNHFLFMSARGAAEKMGILESKGLVVWFRWEYSIGGLTCTADDFQATFYPSSLLKKILGRM